MSLNELHLFAGAGGGILGGILCGHTCVCAVEIEPYPRKVLLQRQRDGILPRFPIWEDVRTFDGKPWRGKVDIVCGGFPCQDISCAGKGAGIEGERSGMWVEMARIIREVSPSFVFVENSPMLTSRGLGRVLGDLAEMGYDARWGVLGAIDAGAPHKRERIWIMADATGDRWGQRIKNGARSREGISERTEQGHRNDGCHVADANSQRCSRGGLSAGKWEPLLHAAGSGRGHESSAPRDGRKADENMADTELRGHEKQWREMPSDIIADRSWWESEPAVGRVAHGVANRVNRLKAIGNGQVPAVAALAWNILKH